MVVDLPYRASRLCRCRMYVLLCDVWRWMMDDGVGKMKIR